MVLEGAKKLGCNIVNIGGQDLVDGTVSKRNEYKCNQIRCYCHATRLLIYLLASFDYGCSLASSSSKYEFAKFS